MVEDNMSGGKLAEKEKKLLDRLLDIKYLGMDKRTQGRRSGKDRRAADRRLHERRQEQFLEECAGRCAPLNMRITPDGCMGVRNRQKPPEECRYCPGVVMDERRSGERRSGVRRVAVNRRSGSDRRAA